MKTYSCYIDGAWRSGSSSTAVVDPGTGEQFAQMTAVGRSETKEAIDAAHRAFATWSNLTAMQRADYLLALTDELRARQDEIAEDITRENGKPFPQGRGEVGMTIDHLRWFAEEARRAYGRIVPPQADGKRHLILRQPIGVVAAIAPWNFPLVLSVRKAAPALAAGCPVILRPASQTPVCAVKLVECAERVGFPAGVFQLLTGPAREIAGELMDNPLVRKLTFTGSTEVGKKLIEQSAHTVTKVSLELGGHAPVLVFGDSALDDAVEGTAIAKFRNTGQSCIAANRVYVERSIYDRFLQRFTDRVKSMKVGYGMESDVEVGAMVNEEALAHAEEHIRDAVDRGARVLCGGERVSGTSGWFLKPTVVADVPADAVCMREETFAPVAVVAPFDSEEEAIAAANSTPYGLAAYAFTSDLTRAFRVAERLEAGTVGINDAVPSTSNCPFGGVKESGVGRELGSEGLDAFLETKHVSIGGVR